MAKEANAEKYKKQIPQRVEKAAMSMMNQASSGPRRGYIPPDSGRIMPTQTDLNAAQNSQAQFYNGQSPVTGSQRGFIMPAGQSSKPAKSQRRSAGFTAALVILLIAALGTGGYFAGSAYLRNKEITEKV